MRRFLCLQELLDPALPEDIEDGFDGDTVTFSIGEALDHIGEIWKMDTDACRSLPSSQ